MTNIITQAIQLSIHRTILDDIHYLLSHILFAG
jgi:hypothetical protein